MSLIDKLADDVKRGTVETILAGTRGSVTKAAQILDMPRETLHRTCKRLGITPSDYRPKEAAQ